MLTLIGIGGTIVFYSIGKLFINTTLYGDQDEELYANTLLILCSVVWPLSTVVLILAVTCTVLSNIIKKIRIVDNIADYALEKLGKCWNRIGELKYKWQNRKKC